MICTVAFVDPAMEKDLWGITMQERLEQLKRHGMLEAEDDYPGLC